MKAKTSNKKNSNNKGYIDISVHDVVQLMKKEDIVIIDVRTIVEYQQGHISGAKLLPLQEIHEWSNQLDRHQKYVLVCRSARRTEIAGTILAEKGFKNIYNMLGGMIKWKDEVGNKEQM